MESSRQEPKESRVFSAASAAKLDDPQRLQWLPPVEVVDKLQLHGDETVADIGAGTGYFSLPIAHALSAGGKVFAVDLQPEMLAFLRDKLTANDPGNVTLHQGSASQTGLDEASSDLIFFANVWHELDDVSAVLAHIAQVLRSNGRLAILDWRKDVSTPPGPPINHRISIEELTQSLNEHGWQMLSADLIGNYSYLALFCRKP